MDKSERFEIRIEPELKEAAEKKAAENNTKLSVVIRDYLKRYVRKK